MLQLIVVCCLNLGSKILELLLCLAVTANKVESYQLFSWRSLDISGYFENQ
ncbi:MAG: hypothetical protein O4752_13740 [Trichodesmium sp. St4_bin8_1]|nr:hypothetical protein [Trichodesmium sp. St4_bin8_1]